MSIETTQMIVDTFEYQILRMLRIFLMWNAIYMIIHFTIQTKLKKLTELDIKNRIISIMHGLLSFGLSAAYIIQHGIDLESPFDYFSSGIICLSFGYFLYDLLACLFFGIWDSKLIIHHFLCVVGLFALLWWRKGLFACVAGLFLAEASNLPMHVRCICRNFGLKHTRLCEYSETLYMIIYVFFRGVLAPILCVLTFMSPSTPILIALVLLGILVQSYFFIFTMIKIMRKKWDHYQERKQKNVHLFWFEVNPEIYELEYAKKSKPDNIF